MMLVVYCFAMQVEPAHRRELLDALLAHGRACTPHEPGTLRFDVLEDDADPNRLYLYEAYADSDAFKAHAAGASHRAAAAVLRTLRERGVATTESFIRGHSLFAAAAVDTR
jgi:quinol monooxygenase YgiN